MTTETATWHMVKYMEDLERREARNVGVVLRQPAGHWLVRFVAETEPGVVNGHKSRSNHLQREVYEAWIRYFRRKLEADALADVERAQGKRRGNFYLEFGGHIFETVQSWEEELDSLFGRVVTDLAAKTKKSTGDRLRARVEQVFQRAHVAPERSVKVRAQYGDDGHETLVPFGYSYVNGQRHLMDVIPLAGRNAGVLARDFESRVSAARRAGEGKSFVAFYDAEQAKGDLDDLLFPIEAQAVAVDLADEEGAVHQVVQLMGH